MAKFLFRLQSFLQLKGKLEEQKKLEYGKALQKVEEEKQIKNRMEVRKIELTDKQRDRINEDFSPLILSDMSQYIIFLTEEIVDQQKKIEKAEELAELKRQELVEAMKERKMLETLKEKDYELYLQEEKLQEQKVVDEIVSFQYAKRNQ